MNRYVIIGGAGFLGLNLASALNRRGDDVTVTGRHQVRPSALAAEPAIDYVPLHLMEIDAVEDLIRRKRPDAVVHMASSIIPGSSAEQYVTERTAVIDPTVRLINLLAEEQIRLVFFSSGGAIYGVSDRESLGEDHPCRPISFYGHAKLELESYIGFAARTRNLRHLIVRPSNPYGTAQSLHGKQGLISTLIGKILQGDHLEVWGDGSTIRDYIHVDDLMASVCDLMDLAVDDLTVNIGSGVGHSLLEVIGLVQIATGKEVSVIYKESRAVDVPKVVLDISLLKSLGSCHHRLLDVGVKNYCRQLGLGDA